METMKPLDLTKPIQTRDGRPAKFLHKLDNPERMYPVMCVVIEGGYEVYMQYTSQGQSVASAIGPHDLINVPVKHVREYWEIYLEPEGAYAWDFIRGYRECDVRATAALYPNRRILACKKITIEFEDGEGLDGFKGPTQERWGEVVKK